MIIDKETQIKVLLYGSFSDPYKIACCVLGVDSMRDSNMSDVFTVTFEEVYQYAKIHGIPKSDYKKDGPLSDGFYYYQQDGVWHTFFKERGKIFDKQEYLDDEAGKRAIVLTLLQLCCTGLY